MNQFQKSLSYNPELIREKSVGGNVLFSTEALTDKLALKPGMNILDLGCGNALSSVFLAKEFGVNVWAVDNFFPATKNYEFVTQNKLNHLIHPLNCDARNLPFPDEFFDCIVSINSYTYFGTDDKYLPYIVRFLTEGGQIGISDICFKNEIDDIGEVPEFLKKDYTKYWYHVHSVEWWKKKWAKTGLLNTIEGNYVSKNRRLIMSHSYIDMFVGKTYEAFAVGLKNDKTEQISFFVLTGLRNKQAAFLEEIF